jgi:hypothetical protein
MCPRRRLRLDPRSHAPIYMGITTQLDAMVSSLHTCIPHPSSLWQSYSILGLARALYGTPCGELQRWRVLARNRSITYCTVSSVVSVFQIRPVYYHSASEQRSPPTTMYNALQPSAQFNLLQSNLITKKHHLMKHRTRRTKPSELLLKNTLLD